MPLARGAQYAQSVLLYLQHERRRRGNLRAAFIMEPFGGAPQAARHQRLAREAIVGDVVDIAADQAQIVQLTVAQSRQRFAGNPCVIPNGDLADQSGGDPREREASAQGAVGDDSHGSLSYPM